MKVIFSKTTYQEVVDKRKQALENSYSLQSTKEYTLQFLLKRLPILICFLMCAKFIIQKCFRPATMTIYNKLVETNTSDISMALFIPVVSICVSLIVIGTAIILLYKLIFWATENALPMNTPLYDRECQNKYFWWESEKIENVLKIMDAISKLSPDDIAFSGVKYTSQNWY